MLKNLSFLLISLSSLSLFSQVPNGGFENWVSAGTYSNPVSWSTMNNTTASFSVFTATSASPGNPGSAYMKLTSKLVGNKVVNGMAVCGKLDTVNLKPLSGFSYTMRPAAFTGRYQHMIFGSSQGSLKVLSTRWNVLAGKRDTIAYGSETLAGMAMSWSNFNINLTYVDSLNYPDTCVIVLQASGANPSVNDYLWVDNLTLTGTVPVVTLPDPNPVGLLESAKAEVGLSIYPNPAGNLLRVKATFPVSDLLIISLVDVTGKNVFTKTSAVAAGDFSDSIELDHLPSGLYQVQLTTRAGVSTKTLVIR